MKPTPSYASVVVISLALSCLLTTAFAQTTANGPYYATPSWDQTLPSSTRFIVLSNFANAAVLDRETGLVWERAPSTSFFDWFTASNHCVQLNLGGRKGWRLPTIQDLASLIDPTQSNPSLPSGHPFTFQLPYYWSATTGASLPSVAWLVDFRNGNAFADGKSGGNLVFRAWCVRGGTGVDPQ
jgi:hypothetical protein